MEIIVPGEQKIVYKGRNIREMKKDLIKNYEDFFNHYIKRNKIPPLTLSEQLTPVTICSIHSTKEKADQFLDSVFKFTSSISFRPIKC